MQSSYIPDYRGVPPAGALYADCPWAFADRLPGESRGAEKNYPVLGVDALKAYPLPPLRDDCILFFWRVSAMQPEALAVVEAWGFTVKSEIVWVKLSRAGSDLGSLHFGLGRYVRAAHETCLIATRTRGQDGKRLAHQPKVLSRSVRSVLVAPYRGHSRKPSEMYDAIEQLCPGPYVELFARDVRPGWFAFGNELVPSATPQAPGPALPPEATSA